MSDRHPSDLVFFLGGRDLEMAAIRALLEEHAPGRFYDAGDAISYYLDHREEIEAEMKANRLEHALEAHGATLDKEGVVRFDGR